MQLQHYWEPHGSFSYMNVESVMGHDSPTCWRHFSAWRYNGINFSVKCKNMNLSGIRYSLKERIECQPSFLSSLPPEADFMDINSKTKLLKKKRECLSTFLEFPTLAQNSLHQVTQSNASLYWSETESSRNIVWLSLKGKKIIYTCFIVKSCIHLCSLLSKSFTFSWFLVSLIYLYKVPETEPFSVIANLLFPVFWVPIEVSRSNHPLRSCPACGGSTLTQWHQIQIPTASPGRLQSKGQFYWKEVKEPV